jgi:hypothetical protein
MYEFQLGRRMARALKVHMTFFCYLRVLCGQ